MRTTEEVFLFQIFLKDLRFPAAFHTFVFIYGHLMNPLGLNQSLYPVVGQVGPEHEGPLLDVLLPTPNAENILFRFSPLHFLHFSFS